MHPAESRHVAPEPLSPAVMVPEKELPPLRIGALVRSSDIHTGVSQLELRDGLSVNHPRTVLGPVLHLPVSTSRGSRFLASSLVQLIWKMREEQSPATFLERAASATSIRR